MLNVKIPSGEVCFSVTALAFPEPFPLSLEFQYASRLEEPSPLGRGWMFPYDITLEREGDEYILRSSGRPLHTFTIADVDAAAAPPGPYSLHSDGTRGFTVKARRERLSYHFAAARHRTYVYAFSDRHGNVTSFDRDPNGFLLSVTDPLARRIEFYYGGDRLRRVILQASPGAAPQLVAECGYDDRKNLSSVSMGVHARTEFTYDNDLLVTCINPLGGALCARYDTFDRCVDVWEQHGRYSRQYAYDDARATVRVVDSGGYSTLYRFNPARQLIAVVDPLGGMTEYARDGGGSLVAKVDPTGRPAVVYRSMAGGGVLERTGPTGSVVTLELSPDGDVAAVLDAQGGKWEYARDGAGRLDAVRTAAGFQWSFEYDAMGRPSRRRDPAGGEVRYRWSEDGRRQHVSDDMGLLFEKHFDALGRMTAFEGPGGAAFSVTYRDASIRGSRDVRNVDGTIRRCEADPMGNPVGFVDETGARWDFARDAYGRLSAATDPTGATVHWEYDGEGRVTSITNQNGQRLENVHDALGRIVRQRGFDRTERHYEYDAAGRLTRRIDGNGVAMQVEPDGLGRAVVRRYSDGSHVETSYGVGDRLVRASNGTAVLEFDYDQDYRRVAERVNDSEVRYRYDWSRQPTGLQSPDGELRYQYDARGTLTGIDTDDGFNVRVSHDRDRSIETRRFDGGLVVERSHDARGRLTRQAIRSETAGDIVSIDYSYDDRSNLIECRRSDREPLAFAHNRRGELIEVRRADRIIRSYAYDPAGNLTTGGAAGTDEYDGEGRPLRQETPRGERTCSYDARGRLIGARVAGGPPVQFEYDFWFRRTSKSSGSTVELTSWAGDLVLGHVLATGARLKYVRHPADPAPVAVRIDGVWHALLSDHHGQLTDVIRLRDAALVWSCDVLGYDWETRVGDDSFPVRVRGAGQLDDPETGLCYQRARYYDPATGRFLSPDPIGVFGGLNFYRFCLNQPLLFTDPFGLAACLTEAECDALFNQIEDNADSIEQRWQEMLTPARDLPWGGAPPVGQLYTAAAVGAMGTPIAVGDTSYGSIDSHIKQHDDEQRGMNNRIQDYYAGQCSRFEDAARAEAMQENVAIGSRAPSLPHLGL